MLSQETLFLSVRGVLTLDTFYDIVLYFEPVDHKFHISICLSGSTLKYLQFYWLNSGTLCIMNWRRNDDSSKTILRIAKLLGVQYIEVYNLLYQYINVRFLELQTKQLMRAGKVNYQVIFHQSLFRIHTAYCKQCWYRLKNN